MEIKQSRKTYFPTKIYVSTHIQICINRFFCHLRGVRISCEQKVYMANVEQEATFIWSPNKVAPFTLHIHFIYSSIANTYILMRAALTHTAKNKQNKSQPLDKPPVVVYMHAVRTELHLWFSEGASLQVHLFMLLYNIDVFIGCISVKMGYEYHIRVTPFSCLPPSLDFSTTMEISNLQ